MNKYVTCLENLYPQVELTINKKYKVLEENETPLLLLLLGDNGQEILVNKNRFKEYLDS